MEDMPKFILTITIVLIIFAVGVISFLSLIEPMGLERGQNQTFTVTDPTVAKRCTLAYNPDADTVIVKQYNGNEWVTVTSTYFSVSGKTVTVESGGLQG